MVVQTVADYKEWLRTIADSIPEEEATECRCLEVEYFILRTAMVGVAGCNSRDDADGSSVG
jgi:hypothetical protein